MFLQEVGKQNGPFLVHTLRVMIAVFNELHRKTFDCSFQCVSIELI
jgi:hypothetical protein